MPILTFVVVWVATLRGLTVPTDLDTAFDHVEVDLGGCLGIGREAEVFSSIDFLAWLYGMLSLAISFLRRISCCHFGQLGESGL